MHCTDIATHSMLGGQHGETSESEVSGEEDGAQDKKKSRAQEEIAQA
jgi:hypothetical protein